MNAEASKATHPSAESAQGRFDAEAAVRALRQIFKQDRSGIDHTESLQRLETMARNMAADDTRRDQPMREVFARLGDKWSTLLVHILRTGNYRHAVLRRLVSAVGIEGRISQRMMTLRLRSLERDGLITRRVIESHPPGVEYVLTALGHDLAGRIETIMQWIREHMDEIRAARQHFDQTSDERAIKGG